MRTERVDLGFRPRKWQAECFLALARFSVLVVHRRAGKTYFAILKLIDEALSCEKERPRYAYLAPLLKQAKGIAWDILKHYASKIPGVVINEAELQVEFPHNHARIRIFGADNPDSLRGHYFDGIVIDEVAQIKRNLWGEVILPALSDRVGWALFIGTPQGINFFSETYYSATADPSWFARVLTCYQTEALSQDQIDQLKASMTDKQFRQEMLCDFLASSDDVLVSIDDARLATKRVIREHQFSFAPKILGVDVAWTGGDRSVIFPRQGLQAFKPHVEKGLPEKAFSASVARVMDAWDADACFVDVTGGYGGEVLSRLTDLGYRVQGVVFSAKPSEERFANLRAEMWFRMAAWVKEGSIPNDPSLVSELCAVTYTNDSASNRLLLESKQDVKEKIGVSPDLADALAMTFAYPVAQRSNVSAMPVRGKARFEYDPLAEPE